MKAHILQTGGLSFIDKLDFNNFNECTRLKISTVKTYPDFRTDFPAGCRPDLCHQCQQKVLYLKDIFTGFPKKGPKPHNKAEKILSAEVSKQRATAMEGAFGNHKNHYGLVKIRVKGDKREKLAVLFGIMAANAVAVAKRRNQQESPPINKAA
ncbi:hypothetical protein QWY93_18955 [Echinicola jeungdonensis]|uniref:hypothetical protein n=1 Tax=Echinicola jeungdonensis TaxID=709343 RepID=UPI0025B48D28|nr:hypothetical protein [Echinicola jeungdonensis]MDN3671348.1 hypothetical protein [Echinicola jeungdonensis]